MTDRNKNIATHRIKTVALINRILIICLELIERNDLFQYTMHYKYKMPTLLFTQKYLITEDINISSSKTPVIDYTQNITW